MFSVLGFSYQQCSLLLCTSSAINLFVQQPYESSDGLFAVCTIWLSDGMTFEPGNLLSLLWLESPNSHWNFNFLVIFTGIDECDEPSLNFTVNSGAEYQVCDTMFAFISFAIKRDGWDYFFNFLPDLVHDWGVESNSLASLAVSSFGLKY
ncbi:hypothetical protein C8R45DRAFT_935998 [Mycena sanguinolenta]|nr:hypothetical protein C8R45DRAFT_935998 [Mycena sanguinolenta]